MWLVATGMGEAGAHVIHLVAEVLHTMYAVYTPQLSLNPGNTHEVRNIHEALSPARWPGCDLGCAGGGGPWKAHAKCLRLALGEVTQTALNCSILAIVASACPLDCALLTPSLAGSNSLLSAGACGGRKFRDEPFYVY